MSLIIGNYRFIVPKQSVSTHLRLTSGQIHTLRVFLCQSQMMTKAWRIEACGYCCFLSNNSYMLYGFVIYHDLHYTHDVEMFHECFVWFKYVGGFYDRRREDAFQRFCRCQWVLSVKIVFMLLIKLYLGILSRIYFPEFNEPSWITGKHKRVHLQRHTRLPKKFKGFEFVKLHTTECWNCGIQFYWFEKFIWILLV